MLNRVLVSAVLLASACALAAEDNYRIELLPTGFVIATDVPASRGNTFLFHRYPAGTYVSLRMTEVRQIHRISAQAAAETNPAKKIVRIQAVSLPGSSQAGPTSLSNVASAPRRGLPSAPPSGSPQRAQPLG